MSVNVPILKVGKPRLRETRKLPKTLSEGQSWDLRMFPLNCLGPCTMAVGSLPVPCGLSGGHPHLIPLHANNQLCLSLRVFPGCRSVLSPHRALVLGS